MRVVPNTYIDPNQHLPVPFVYLWFSTYVAGMEGNGSDETLHGYFDGNYNCFVDDRQNRYDVYRVTDYYYEADDRFQKVVEHLKDEIRQSKSQECHEALVRVYKSLKEVADV